MQRLLYDHYDPVTTRATWIETDPDTGLPLIVRSQDIKPIVESAKRLAAQYDPHRRASIRHVARVPAVTWVAWSRLGITRDEQALKAVLQMRECRAFRTDNGGPI